MKPIYKSLKSQSQKFTQMVICRWLRAEWNS